ncbi:PEP-CTERM sorting domain-containing protein [Aquabacterium sp. A7-Y]|uniref:PEP-CTERM sorting domain-containing protein n=1 Tax=Aquabacterium sp. A7-Y TaxID=1349605 RepID=UPI00223D69E1|nr:PEP-CTERM sorting domain-containing protein [Aquabacterium sp. A7-Y]MCW7539973.1 PEP-CTERM sorting domain-containing protein [Aquabacterium sp. A7-Y]
MSLSAPLWLAAPLLACACLQITPAQAAGSGDAYAEIADLQWSVEDLAPADNVRPEFVIGSGGILSSLRSIGMPYVYRGDEQSELGAFEPRTLSSRYRDSFAGVVTGADRLRTHGRAGPENNVFSNTTASLGAIHLTPQTRLTLTGTATVGLSCIAGAGADHCTFQDQAAAWSWLTLRFGDDVSSPGSRFIAKLDATDFPTDYHGEALTLEQTFVLSVENRSDVQREVQFSALQAIFTGNAAPPPVPEPGTWALLAAGLGLLVARRRAAAAAALACLGSAFAPLASAVPAQLETVRDVISASSLPSVRTPISGVAIDPATGMVWERLWTNPQAAVATYKTYTSIEAFEADAYSGLRPNALGWGTYFAARDGQLYSHASSDRALIGREVAETGTPIDVAVVPGMGGENGVDSFDWGGYTAANMLSDGEHLYAVGGAAGSAGARWQITTYDTALNPLRTVSFAAADRPGFAFAIDGRIVFGDDYDDDHISMMVDAATGAIIPLDVTLQGQDLGGPSGWGFGSTQGIYIENAFYDHVNDAVYFNDAGTYLKLAEASQVFGIMGSVPEPQSVLMLLAGLPLLWWGSRWRAGSGRVHR